MLRQDLTRVHETSAPAAFAEFPAGHGGDVPELAGRAVASVVDIAIQHQGAADPRADCECREIAVVAAGAKQLLRDREGVDVVVYPDRGVHSLGQHFREGKITPAETRALEADAVPRVHFAWDRYADPHGNFMKPFSVE